MIKQELYFSTDIESDGPIPGINSMLSFGTAVFSPKGELIDTFTANLLQLDGAIENPATMSWWKENLAAWNKCREDPKDPAIVMKEYYDWINFRCNTELAVPVFVGYPAGYDFLFIYWYLMKFVGNSPFSFSALDIKTYASAVLKKPYRECTKRKFPAKWFSKECKHTHITLDDAIEQGYLFINMLNENTKGISL